MISKVILFSLFLALLFIGLDVKNVLAVPLPPLPLGPQAPSVPRAPNQPGLPPQPPLPPRPPEPGATPTISPLATPIPGIGGGETPTPTPTPKTDSPSPLSPAGPGDGGGGQGGAVLGLSAASGEDDLAKSLTILGVSVILLGSRLLGLTLKRVN